MTGPPITVSVEVDRPQEEVFAYVTDPSRFAEWQAGVVGGHTDNGAAMSVGSKCMTTRRIGGAEREVTSEVTKLDPPRAWAVRDGNLALEQLLTARTFRVAVRSDARPLAASASKRAPAERPPRRLSWTSKGSPSRPSAHDRLRRQLRQSALARPALSRLVRCGSEDRHRRLDCRSPRAGVSLPLPIGCRPIGA